MSRYGDAYAWIRQYVRTSYLRCREDRASELPDLGGTSATWRSRHARQDRAAMVLLGSLRVHLEVWADRVLSVTIGVLYSEAVGFDDGTPGSVIGTDGATTRLLARGIWSGQV